MGGKHTEGPWIEDEACICSAVGAGVAVCQMVRPDEFWGLPDEDVPAEVVATISANARLIAAAPELLEALTYFRDQLDSFRDSSSGNQADAYYHFVKGQDAAWTRARAAIAKATGDQP